MRVLIVHNQAWAHYKSVLFQEIHREFKKNYPEGELLVAHIALHEQIRAVMASDEKVVYDYPQVVLFRRSLDSVSFSKRLMALFRVFREYRPDVLNVTGWFDLAQVLLALHAMVKGVKIVISSESSSLDKQRKPFKESLKKLFLIRADAFFCFGKSSVDYLISLGISEPRILVKRAAVVDNELIFKVFTQSKQAKFSETNGRNFIYIGRLAKEKNLALLLAAYRRCVHSSAGADWGLIFVGDGPLKQQLEKEAVDSGLSGIRFTGGMPWHKVPSQLAWADVLILPSLSEPWGLVVNEAMVCGMPVIVSQNCGCSDDLVADGKNGYLFDPVSVDSLTKAMNHYIDSPAEIAPHGRVSQVMVADFSPEKVAAQMVDSYRRLASKSS